MHVLRRRAALVVSPAVAAPGSAGRVLVGDVRRQLRGVRRAQGARRGEGARRFSAREGNTVVLGLVTRRRVEAERTARG